MRRATNAFSSPAETVDGVFRACVLGGFVLACTACGGRSSQGAPAPVGEMGFALSAAVQDILGFEKAGLWSTSTGPINTLSSVHTEGTSSLSVVPRGYVAYVSKPLSSLGEVAGVVAYDVWLPSPPANPHWSGASQLFFSIPSKNQFNVYVGQKDLMALPLNAWSTLSFNLTSAMVQALKSTYTDLTFTLVLNVPTNTNAAFRLDNLRLATVCPTVTVLPPPDAGPTPATCGQSVDLRAAKGHSPASVSDGLLTFPQRKPFTIPPFVPVVAGSAGNKSLFLGLKQGGREVACRYVGGSTQAHPTTPQDVALGRQFFFASCTACNIKPGDVVAVDSLTLHVDDGDPLSGATTAVELLANCEEVVPVVTPAPSDMINPDAGPPTPPGDQQYVPGTTLPSTLPSNSSPGPFTDPNQVVIDPMQGVSP